jgi:hypothetical protein
MLTALLSILGSSAVGSILGSIFAILNRKADIEAKKLDLAHEAARWAHDLVVKDKDIEYARIEAAGRKDVAVIEGDATVEAARMTAIAAAQANDAVKAEELKAAGKWKGLLVIASTFNKLIRPVATIILVGAALRINFELIDRLNSMWPALSPLQQLDTFTQALVWTTGQASMVLSYWFVARGSSR